MGKVRSGERRALVNETIDARPKRRKRKKDLEKLRRNVLETKRNLRAAPRKTSKTTLTRALDNFADRRQDNDNKVQGIDNKGDRTTRKTVCSRLLPALTTRKDIGIFANGAKSGEIKRAILPLNEVNRARLQSDVQKLLRSGDFNGKKSIQNNFENTSRGPCVENCVDDPNINSRAQTISPVLGKLNSAKRKLFIAAQQPERALKKSEFKTTVHEDLSLETKVARNIQEEGKYRRRLFEDDEKEFKAIDQFDVEELRFSPKIVKTNVSAAILNAADTERDKKGNDRASLNLQDFYWAPEAKYEDLCAMVCVKRFENCFQDVPYTDPVKKVSKTLMNICSDTCQRYLLRKKVKFEEQDETRSLATSNLDDDLPSKLVNPLLGSSVEIEACVGNESEDTDELPNFETFLIPRKRDVSKEQENRTTKENKNELFVTAFGRNFDSACNKLEMEELWNKNVQSSQLTGNISENAAEGQSFSPELESSMIKDVSRRKRKHASAENANMSDLLMASVEVHNDVESPKTLRSNLSQTLPSGLESTDSKNTNVHKTSARDDLIMRFLEDVNVRKLSADARSMFPEETFPLPAQERATTKRYLGDPLRRHEIGFEVSNRNVKVDKDDENLDSISVAKNFGARNEKHVPAILRRAGSRGLTKYKNENAELIATLLSRELEISNSNSTRNNVIEDRDIFEKEDEASSGYMMSKDSPIEDSFASQMTRDPQLIQHGTFQTPSVVNVLNERNEHVLKSKRNFMNAKYKTASRDLVCGTNRNECLPNEIFLQAQANDHSKFTFGEKFKEIRNAIQRQNSNELNSSKGQSKKILLFEKKDLRNCQKFHNAGLAQQHDTARDGTSIPKKVSFVKQDPFNPMNFVIQHPGSSSNDIPNFSDSKQQNLQDSYCFMHQQPDDVRTRDSQGLQDLVYSDATANRTNANAQNVQILTFENPHDPTKIPSFVHRNDPTLNNDVRQNVVFENQNPQNVRNLLIKEAAINGDQNIQILPVDDQQGQLMMRGSIGQQGTCHIGVQQKSRTFAPGNLQRFQQTVPNYAAQNHTNYSRSFGVHGGAQNLQVLTLGKQSIPHKAQNFVTGKLQNVSTIPQTDVQPNKFLAFESHYHPHRIPIYVQTDDQSNFPRKSSSRSVNLELKPNQAHLFVEQAEPKVLSIPDHNLQNRDQVFYEQQVRIPMSRGNFQNLQKNVEENLFQYSLAATEAMYSQENVSDTTNRNGMQRLMQNGQLYQNDVQNLGYPVIMYQGDAGMKASSVETDIIGCEGTSDVRNEMFRNGVYQDESQYRSRFGTDPNFDVGSNAPKRIKLMNGKIGLLVPRNGSLQNIGQSQKCLS